MTTVTHELHPVAALIEDERQRRGLSLRQTADALGVTHLTVRAWSRGANPTLTTDFIGRLCRFLGLEPMELWRRIGWDELRS